MTAYKDSFKLKPSHYIRISGVNGPSPFVVISDKVFSGSFYLRLPSVVTHVSIFSGFFSVVYSNKCLSYNLFKKRLIVFLNTSTPRKKKLLLRGVGFKASVFVTPDLRCLNFKLGYSHSISIPIPKVITAVAVKKNTLFFQSMDSSVLGNFIELIKRLRVPDCYKGKGFSTKYSQKIIKPVKKK
jgi:hypothetical protein